MINRICKTVRSFFVIKNKRAKAEALFREARHARSLGFEEWALKLEAEARALFRES